MMGCGRLDETMDQRPQIIKNLLHANLKNSQSVGMSQLLCGRHVCSAVSSVQVDAGDEMQL